MARYALMYARLNVAKLKQETVVAYYVEGTRITERHEYIQAPLLDAEQTMKAQGWKYASSAGPQSILMQHA